MALPFILEIVMLNKEGNKPRVIVVLFDTEMRCEMEHIIQLDNTAEIVHHNCGGDAIGTIGDLPAHVSVYADERDVAAEILQEIDDSGPFGVEEAFVITAQGGVYRMSGATPEYGWEWLGALSTSAPDKLFTFAGEKFGVIKG